MISSILFSPDRAASRKARAPNENSEPILPLLRFHSLNHPQDWISFDQYLADASTDQKEIYYLLGDNETAALHSPHLEAFRARGVDVLILAEPIDPFAVLNLTQYKDHQFANAATAELPTVSDQKDSSDQSEISGEPPANEDILQRFKAVLGDRISDARLSDRLVESPVRLAQAKDGPSAEIQRVYRMLQKDIEIPSPVLEINPNHSIIKALSALDADDPAVLLIIEQIFANAQIMEGLPVEPSQMVDRIQKIILQAMK